MSNKSDSPLQLSRSIYLTSFWADQSQNTGCPTGKYLRAITSEQTFFKLTFSQEKTNTTCNLIDNCIWLIDAKSQGAPFKHLEPGGGERLSRDSYPVPQGRAPLPQARPPAPAVAKTRFESGSWESHALAGSQHLQAASCASQASCFPWCLKGTDFSYTVFLHWFICIKWTFFKPRFLFFQDEKPSTLHCSCVCLLMCKPVLF